MTMTKLIEVKEIPSDQENLKSLLGKRVLLICSAYFYEGRLIGVNEHFALLEDAHIVYETGPWGDKNWKDAQKLGCNLRVMFHAIESWCEGKGETA